MDDEAIYGEEFYNGFGEAVEHGMLTDYKVLILTLNENDIPQGVQNMIAGRDSEVNTDDASKLIGCINALSKKVLGDDGSIKVTDPDPMRRAVAFCSNIAVSKQITDTFNDASDVYLEDLEAGAPGDGSRLFETHRRLDECTRARRPDVMAERLQRRDQRRVLTNVGCLSEEWTYLTGCCHVPLPEKLTVDVVQSVGRVMRLAEGKKSVTSHTSRGAFRRQA